MKYFPPTLRSGFTLVEILVVVVILGIIGAIVGTQLGSRDDLKATAAARVLMADLQYAQNRALARREAHYLIVGSGNASVTINTLSGGSWQAVTHPIDPGALQMTFGPGGSGGGESVALVSTDFGDGAVFGFDATGEPFSCAADGSSKSSLTSAATLTLRAGTFDAVVRIEPVTGEIIIQ